MRRVVELVAFVPITKLSNTSVHAATPLDDLSHIHDLVLFRK